MALNKYTAFILLFFSVFYISAQEGSFFLETSPRFVQRFTWTASTGASRYEVLIEKNENGQFTRVMQEFTAETFIEVSLHAGVYRYRVTPYDFLNRPGQPSEWRTVEIHPALNPVLERFSPSIFYLTNRDLRLELTGKNFIESTEFYITHMETGNSITPDEVNILSNGTRVRLSFSDDNLTIGDYSIHARNPGGLEAHIGNLTVARRERQSVFQNGGLNWYIGAAWSPLLYFQNSETIFHIEGAGINIGIISAPQGFFNVGMEIQASLYANKEFSLEALVLENNFLLQKQFLNGAMAFTLKAGIGLILPAQAKPITSIEEAMNPLNNKVLFANAGISFLWLPAKHFFIEAGVNYSYVFIADNYSGCIRPRIGVGVIF